MSAPCLDAPAWVVDIRLALVEDIVAY